MRIEDIDSILCWRCLDKGYISGKEAEYVWNSEENLLDVEMVDAGETPCPNCTEDDDDGK
jgi:hypothetical protein